MYRVLYRLTPRKDTLLKPAEMWQKITSRLPEEITQATEGPRVLWRQEGASTVLVQYPVEPPPTWFPPGTQGHPQMADMSPLLEGLAPGQVWAFDLTAVPVRRAESREYPVAVEEWLTEDNGDEGTSRAWRSGFRVLRMASQMQRRKTPKVAPLHRVHGLLEVQDVEALRTALEEGLGRGKARGAGMLSLHHPPAAATKPSSPATRSAIEPSRPEATAHGPDLPADPGQPLTVEHWQHRWPMGAEKIELIDGAALWCGQFDARDVQAAQRAFPGRRIRLDAAGSLYVIPTGPAGDDLAAKLSSWQDPPR